MTPRVHVLLATCNGERHLAQQWASLEAQQGVELVLHVTDDGSSDGTLALLHQLAARRAGAVTQVHWVEQPPRRCASASFLLLLREALAACPDARWLAFCDQDDVWLPGKLARAVGWLSQSAAGGPALYGGRTISVDADDREQGLSRPPRHAPCFRNAIAENVIGGNTMVLNAPAARLLAASADMQVRAHDWLAYQLVTAVGGEVRFDSEPFVRYRQHGGNVVGGTVGWRPAARRLARLLRGDYGGWMNLHLRALQARQRELPGPQRAVLEAFVQARDGRTPWGRLASLRRSGAFRQGRVDQVMLVVACLLGRI